MIGKVWRTFYEGFYTFLVGLALKLRYRIRVDGVEFLTPDSRKGHLFLSNHVAKIDPVILEYLFWPRFHLRPLAVDYLFNNPVVRWFLNSVGAIPVPNVVPGGDRRQLVQKVNEFYHRASQILDEKGSVLLYPSGRLSRDGKEAIIHQNSAYSILHMSKECHVFLIRISGLWGSIFSLYRTRQSPPLGKAFKEALKALLKRGIFFMPRRQVKVTVRPVTSEYLKQFATKQDLNAFLASWFNDERESFPVEVPYN